MRSSNLSEYTATLSCNLYPQGVQRVEDALANCFDPVELHATCITTHTRTNFEVPTWIKYWQIVWMMDFSFQTHELPYVRTALTYSPSARIGEDKPSDSEKVWMCQQFNKTCNLSLQTSMDWGWLRVCGGGGGGLIWRCEFKSATSSLRHYAHGEVTCTENCHICMRTKYLFKSSLFVDVCYHIQLIFIHIEQNLICSD